MIEQGGKIIYFPPFLGSTSDGDNQSKIYPAEATGGRRNKKTSGRAELFIF